MNHTHTNGKRKHLGSIDSLFKDARRRGSNRFQEVICIDVSSSDEEEQRDDRKPAAAPRSARFFNLCDEPNDDPVAVGEDDIKDDDQRSNLVTPTEPTLNRNESSNTTARISGEATKQEDKNANDLEASGVARLAPAESQPEDASDDDAAHTQLSLCQDTAWKLEERIDTDATYFTPDQVGHLFKDFEKVQHTSLTEIEMGGLVKSSKVSHEDSKTQKKALYGRAMVDFGEYLVNNVYSRMQEEGLSKVFVDVGSGIGTVCVQMALTTGCEARGIELKEGRNLVANTLLNHMKDLIGKKIQQGAKVRHGQVRLRHGQLQDIEHRDFLTDNETRNFFTHEENSRRVHRVFCNNFNEVFASRAENGKDYSHSPDDFVAGLFTQMPIGAELVTLHPLPGLPRPRTEVDKARMDNGLDAVAESSFYEMKKFDIPEGQHGKRYLDFLHESNAFTVFRYSKVSKSAEFVCSHKGCQAAMDGTRIQAWAEFIEKTNIHGQKGKTTEEPRIIPVSVCPNCQTSYKGLRRRPSTGKHRGGK